MESQEVYKDFKGHSGCNRSLVFDRAYREECIVQKHTQYNYITQQQTTNFNEQQISNFY